MAGKIKYFPEHLYNSVLWYELITCVMTEQFMYKKHSNIRSGVKSQVTVY